MFCARCGQQIPDASEICPLCGREATLKLDPPPAMPTATPAAAAAPGQIQWPAEPAVIGPPMRRPDLKGVGGWLMFFCISLTLLSPLFMAARVWGDGMGLVSMIDIAVTAFGMVVGIMLWNVHPRAFLLLWIYFGLLAFFLVLGIAGSFVGSEEQNPNQFVLLFRGLIYVIVWFSYFKKSDRVQATFGRNL
ncbi:MAG TPA: DUF2569 family protein [Candidatus Acidoferrales bacterium]|nr:DUF2569 family protein [Candidatus Acidoferrales bacterium]